MELEKQVTEVIDRQSVAQGSFQSQRIEEATRIFDQLVERGLIDRPSYRLAPMNSVPPKAFSSIKPPTI